MFSKRCVRVLFLIATIALALSPMVRADDLSGAERLLCAATEATICSEGGSCQTASPRQLNIPDFIEVDLQAKLLRTTQASAEQRQTPFLGLTRKDGMIVIQGFENERAFSFNIDEATGALTAAVARPGVFVGAFGACTPLTGTRTEEGR